MSKTKIPDSVIDQAKQAGDWLYFQGKQATKDRLDRKRIEQKSDVINRAQQKSQQRRVAELLAQNMNSGAPSAQDKREMRLTAAKGLEERAKQQYEGYKNSEQRKTDWDKAIRDAVMEIPAAGSSLDLALGKLPEKTINQTEAQHEAVADYFEQNRKAVQDTNTMGKDVEEVAQMSDEDRRLLETYAYGRNEWFDHQRIADSVSARAELEKKYGKQKVEELAESWQRYQNAVSAEKNRQQTQEGAGSGFFSGVGHSAASVAANALGTLTAPFGYLQEAFGRTGRYQTLDPNNAGAMPGQYASAVRGAVSEDMGTAGKVLYQGTMGAMDNLARIAMGGGTKFGSLGLAAIGSFGSTLSEASAQGATPAQAVGKAVLSAGIEVATEKVPLDELFKAGKSGYKGAAAAFRQALKQGGIEAAEEEIALLGNVLVDALVMREKSDYNQQIGKLVAGGMSYQDAKNQADRQLWDEAVNTAFTSWISGGVMSGAQSGAQYVGQQMQEREQMRSDLASQIRGMMDRENAGNATQNATGGENATADETVETPTRGLEYHDAALEQARVQAPVDDGSQEAINAVMGVKPQSENQKALGETAGTKRQMPAVDAENVRYDRNGRTELPVSAPTENGAPDVPQGAETGGFGDDAGDAMYKSVGAAGQQFKHEVRKSKIYENTYKNATDPDVKSAGERAAELDPKIAEYDYISEKESMYHARERLDTPDGLEAELEYLVGKQGWTGEDNDTAMLILKQLQKDGDADAFKALARAQREQGTTGGQFIQSFAKYSRDATKAAVDAVGMLDKLGKGDVPKKFWKKSESFEAWKNDILKSTMEIANDIEAVEDGNAEDMRKIVRQLANFRRTTAWWGQSSKLTKIAERILRKLDFNTAKDIACAQLAKIPDDFRSRSKGEVAKAIRYQNMLSSLVTVARNVVGNGTMGMVDAFSDATAGQFADLLLSKVTGKRTVGNDIRYGKTYLDAAKDAASMASLLAELDIPAEHEGKYTGRTRTFSPQGGPLSRFLSAYEKYMNYALQVSDEFFSGGTAGAVSKSLEALGEKSGLSDEEIAALSDRAGRRRTFKEGRKLAKASGKMKDALNEIGTEDFGAGDVILAFAETPAEMGQVAIDYSGTGILEGFAEMASIVKDARNGKAIDVERQRKAATDFGRGVTGVGMIALFTALAAKGLIAVHDDEDKDKRGLEQSLGLSGAQFNLSATIRDLLGKSTEWQDNDLVMSIDFLQPFNSQMYIGYLLSQEEEIGLKEYAGASVRGIAQSVLDIPAMGTIEDIADLMTSFGEVSEGDFSAVTDAAGQLIGNQASSFVPAWMRQTAQYIDPVYRDTTGENTLDAAKNRVMSGIPFLSQTLPAKYDGLGNLQTRYDDKLMGFFNTFLNPGALTRIQTSDIADKLEELGDKSLYPEYLAPKSFQVNGETVMVSGKEMTETYQKTYGDNVAALYGGLMESEDFQKLSKEQQIAALKQAKTYATQLAKAAVSDFDDIPQGTAEELTKGIVQKQAEKAMSGSFDDLTKAWKNGADDMKAREALENAFSVFDGLSTATQEAIAQDAGGRLGYYLEAKKTGMETETFVELYRKYWEIDQGEKTTSQKAQEWAYALERAYESRTITRNQRDVLKDEMVYMQMFPAETEKFDQLTEGGLSADEAQDLGWLIQGLKIQDGYKEVRDIQKAEAITKSAGLSEEDKIAALKIYGTDAQDENLDQMIAMGYSSRDYLNAWKLISNEKEKGGNGTKRRTINALAQMYGVSTAKATEIYEVWYPKSK